MAVVEKEAPNIKHVMLNLIQHLLNNKQDDETEYVYLLSNKNRTVLYIGVSSNMIERVTDHKNSKGLVFTKKYNVSDLLHVETFTNMNDAIKREKQLKT